jgi:hypothetical protein
MRGELLALMQFVLLFGAPCVVGWLLLRASFAPLALTATRPTPQAEVPIAGDGGRRRPWYLVGATLLLFAAPAMIAVVELPAIQEAARRRDNILPLRVVLDPLLREEVTGDHWKRALLSREAAGENVTAAAAEVLHAAFDGLSTGETLRHTGALGVAALACTVRPGTPTIPPSDAAGLASRVLDGCFPKPPLSAVVTEPNTVTLRLAEVMDWAGDLIRVTLLRRVRVDGEDVGPTLAHGVPLLSPLSDDIELHLDRPVTPGLQTLTVEVDLFLYTRFDAKRLRDSKGLVRPVDHWPEPLTRTPQTFTITLTR